MEEFGPAGFPFRTLSLREAGCWGLKGGPPKCCGLRVGHLWRDKWTTLSGPLSPLPQPTLLPSTPFMQRQPPTPWNTLEYTPAPWHTLAHPPASSHTLAHPGTPSHTLAQTSPVHKRRKQLRGCKVALQLRSCEAIQHTTGTSLSESTGLDLTKLLTCGVFLGQ